MIRKNCEKYLKSKFVLILSKMSVVMDNKTAFQMLETRVPEIMEILENDTALSQMLLDMINRRRPDNHSE